jgi:AraC-like DNA-binding protein
MKRATKFLISSNWLLMFKDMGIDTEQVLSHAQLPADLFIRGDMTLTPSEYFRMWQGIAAATEDRDLPLLLAEHMTVEAFDPPIFACICSPNLNVAMQRLSHYKPLIGPMILDVSVGEISTSLAVSCYGNEDPLPNLLSLCELVFFTQLARLATRENIQPSKIVLENVPDKIDHYEAFFGCAIEKGNQVQIEFSAQDAKRPFLTSNAAMWDFFEAKLNQNLANLDANATTVERVRAVLLEAIPSGDCSIEKVASELAMSKRTLQRKLTSEADSFQAVLQNVRTELADHYLEKSKLSLGEISFLLGFNETNSFIRAYSNWKGVSPGSYREGLN